MRVLLLPRPPEVLDDLTETREKPGETREKPGRNPGETRETRRNPEQPGATREQPGSNPGQYTQIRLHGVLYGSEARAGSMSRIAGVWEMRPGIGI
jgi:hypothetical protein